MTFLEIIRDHSTDLPIEQNTIASFREILRQKLNDFGTLLDESDDLSTAVNNVEFVTADVIKERNKIIRNGILETIDAYYEGDINRSYKILSEFMAGSNLQGYLNKNFALEPNKNLYRIRVMQGNYALTREELFHIPFHLRGKVATQRYSIPGLPSLYLSNSIYVAWEELRRPGFDEVQAIRFSNTRALKLLDLSNDLYVRNSHLINNTSHGWELLYKVMVWPLIAACSIKVRNPDDTFKPEYIIPQLLLQWVNKNAVDGIKYSSTHVNFAGVLEGDFFNIVLPVKSFDKDYGYCSHLKKMFSATQVISMQLRQFIQSDRLEGQESISTHVNEDIKSIELIKGNPQRYSSTSFGILEHSLHHLPLEPFE